MAKIIISKHMFGADIDGAMERALKDTSQSPTQPPITAKPAINIDDWVYVPKIGLYVSEKKLLHNLNYDDTHKELEQLDLSMPMPAQFREFLKFLRDSNAQEHQKIFKEITEARDPWRAEWLNAKFEQRSDSRYMLSQNAIENGKCGNIEQKLTNYLNEDKTPGISLDAWLDSKTSHGLPEPTINNGKFYYWAPVSGYVARVDALSLRAVLDCDGHPEALNPSLGVHACAVAPKKIYGVK